MTPRSPLSRIVLVLCFFAVLGAQLFGVTRGFVCDCSGKKEAAQTSSCYGPHGEKCHANDAQQSGSHDDKGKGERKEHEQVKEDLTGTNAPVPHVVIAAPVMLAVLPELLLFAPESLAAPLEYLSDAYGGPPLNIAVARTVVLRI